MVMRKVLLFVFPAFLLFPVIASSQLLKGRVLSESGVAAAGVTVHFQNKANKISTNPDGTFKIMATKLPDTLIFYAVGLEPYKVVINEKNIKDPDFEVVLLNKRTELSEVVVVGYGSAKKRDVTGSVSSVESLDDRAAGIAVTDYKAASPVRIRGASSSTFAAVGMAADKTFFFADTNIGGRTGSLAKSRILTAGEVNDFYKWKMWEDYTENEFRAMRTTWGMTPNKRYSVQLTNQKRNAVINEAVYLINKITNDTVWKAYTDNTGKAELWAGFFKDSGSEDEYYISDSHENISNKPSVFSQGMNLLSVNKSCQLSNDVDIAFVVDATGSMGDEIEFLKLELEDVIRGTMEKYSTLNLKAASVFYRDRGDEYVAKMTPFHDDLLKTLNFIKLQRAGGGGDTPEALDEALSTALDSLQWNSNARTKLLFLVLDAPPHLEARERIQRLTLKAAAMGVRIVPIACSGTDKSTEFLLRSMALATNGTYAFLTNHSGVGNSHIEPTTDKYEVELLNNLLQRLIGQFLYAKDCDKEDVQPMQETRQPANVFDVKVYPNPTSGQFTIETKKDIKEIFVADFTGKILMRISDTGRKGRWRVDIGKYPSGMYLVKYITGDNKWGAEKVILVR